MEKLKTLSGKDFQYKEINEGEIIVYPSDKDNQSQEKFALVVTPFTINLVKNSIKQAGRILMGASRDNPPKDSLGYILIEENQTPQQLSYLIPILIKKKFCTYDKEGKAFVVRYKGE
jgi:hypothetical protein